MKLKQLLAHLERSPQFIPDIDVFGIQYRSDMVQKGDIFVAIKGFNDDGHNYIEDAVLRGAVSVVGEKPLTNVSVPYFQVEDAREALGKLASIFYHHPSNSHQMIGVTGTNGKTTTSFLLRHLLQSSEQSCSLLSTVANFINGEKLPSTATTPNAIELQKLLSKSNDDFVVLEVSSHGLDQKRVEGIGFDYAIFTNLSHEHLDYHKDLEQYFLVKSELFNKLKPSGKAIINSSCPWGKRLIKKLQQKGVPVYTYGHSGSDHLQLLSHDGDSRFKVRWSESEWEIDLPLPGQYNVQNALAAILVALLCGMNFHTIKHSLKFFSGVPGRFEVYEYYSRNVTFIVDYAHTPDGLLQFLQTVKGFKQNRLVHIFGFRGNRDLSKRDQMMQISSKLSNEIILTIDDLNGVNKEVMMNQLHELARKWGNGKAHIISDRTLAIEYAWNHAQKGDIIAITGKGPEKYRESFALPTKSDAETVQYLFAQRLSFVK